MYRILREMLWAYIVHNHPELFFKLHEAYMARTFIEEKTLAIMPEAERMLASGRPQEEVEEYCFQKMTSDLGASRYRYLYSVLEEEFPKDFNRLAESGKLTYELVKMAESFQDTFQAFGFSKETVSDRHLRHAIIQRVHDWLV